MFRVALEHWSTGKYRISYLSSVNFPVDSNDFCIQGSESSKLSLLIKNMYLLNVTNSLFRMEITASAI